MSQSTLDSNGLGVSRSRADHPLFPRRTTSLPMNNAFSRGNRYADCRSVPTYTPPPLSRSRSLFLFLFSLSSVFRPSLLLRLEVARLRLSDTRGGGFGSVEISYLLRSRCFPVFFFFFLIFAFIAVDGRDDEARRRAGCLKSGVGFEGRRNPRA